MMSKQKSTELPEDIEVVGPGQMLADARIKMNLSVEDVAEQLNFRVCQVKEIEADRFDKSTPATFIRGYLLNYAKMVNVETSDILASYKALSAAEKQGAEMQKMQSFSKITKKEAEHSRLMWLSYFIIFVLVALTILYYFQDVRSTKKTLIKDIPVVTPTKTLEQKTQASIKENTQSPQTENHNEVKEINNELASEQPLLTAVANHSDTDLTTNISLHSTVASPINKSEPMTSAVAVNQITNNHAVFTFSGDCWVNIHDGNGERIAYGVKKTGYIMELNGVAPFKVTVGKPELVAITLNGHDIDMRKYRIGDIAKFTLPETPES